MRGEEAPARPGSRHLAVVPRTLRPSGRAASVLTPGPGTPAAARESWVPEVYWTRSQRGPAGQRDNAVLSSGFVPVSVLSAHRRAAHTRGALPGRPAAPPQTRLDAGGGRPGAALCPGSDPRRGLGAAGWGLLCAGSPLPTRQGTRTGCAAGSCPPQEPSRGVGPVPRALPAGFPHLPPGVGGAPSLGGTADSGRITEVARAKHLFWSEAAKQQPPKHHTHTHTKGRKTVFLFLFCFRSAAEETFIRVSSCESCLLNIKIYLSFIISSTRGKITHCTQGSVPRHSFNK